MHVQREEKRSWFNLAAQEIQPLYYYELLDGQGWLRSRGCPEDAWNGGCSLMLDGLIPAVCASPVCAKCVSARSLLTPPTVTSLNTQVLYLLGSSPSMLRCFLRLWWGSSIKLLMGSQSLWGWRRHRLVFANAQTTMLVNVRYMQSKVLYTKVKFATAASTWLQLNTILEFFNFKNYFVNQMLTV